MRNIPDNTMTAVDQNALGGTENITPISTATPTIRISPPGERMKFTNFLSSEADGGCSAPSTSRAACTCGGILGPAWRLDWSLLGGNMFNTFLLALCAGGCISEHGKSTRNKKSLDHVFKTAFGLFVK